MTQQQVTDEMLMAFVDGELDEAATSRIESLLATDTDLAARAEKLLESRELIREAFAPVGTETVPAHLVSAALGTTQDLAPRRGGGLSQWAVAASVAVVAGLAGFAANGLMGTREARPSLVAMATSSAVLDTLAATAAGQEVRLDVAGSPLAASVVGSFPVAAGYCRLFTVAADDEQVRALACGGDGDWSVPVAVVEGSAGFQPASGAEAIDVYLDSAGAGAALDSAAEADAIGRSWAP